jgi:membrane protease subunit HflK
MLGLAIQFALGAVMLLYALFARGPGAGTDHTGITIFLLSAGGLLPWFGLMLVFHQHKLDAIEAIEAERLAGAEQTSVFDEQDDLRIAHRRLLGMYKYMLPVISLALAAYYAGIGYWRLRSAGVLVDPEAYMPVAYPGWGVALGAILALMGFIFASFVAGMSNQPAWQNLRGGAGAIVASSLACFALIVALGIEMLNYDWAVRYLQVALPWFMIFLGAEIVLNFIFNVYRPRSRGEMPRPAFDSRLLAMVAQPQSVAKSVGDALSYQFGFDVSDTWMYKLLSRVVASLVVLAILSIWGLSCLVIVEPNEQAIVTRFGHIVRSGNILSSGLHLKAPWPIERVERFESLRIHQIQLATIPDETKADLPILWTNDHAENPTDYLVVAPSASGVVAPEAPVEGESAASDFSLLNAEVPVQYRLKDILAFVKLAPESDREELLRTVATRELTRLMATRQVDQILGPERTAIAQQLATRIQAAFDRLGPVDESGQPAGAGVEVVFVGLANAHPPKDEDVALTFQQIVQAQQDKVTEVEQGRAAAVETLANVAGSLDASDAIVESIAAYRTLVDAGAPREDVIRQQLEIQDLIEQAGGEAARMILQARAERWQAHMRERARATEFDGQLQAYLAAPQLYIWRRVLDVYQDELGDTRLFVNNTDARARWRVNLESEEYFPSGVVKDALSEEE